MMRWWDTGLREKTALLVNDAWSERTGIPRSNWIMSGLCSPHNSTVFKSEPSAPGLARVLFFCGFGKCIRSSGKDPYVHWDSAIAVLRVCSSCLQKGELIKIFQKPVQVHNFAHQSSLNLMGLKVWIHIYCLSRSNFQKTEKYYF